MKRAVIASGEGRYADPWHPYPKTSPRIAAVLSEAGFDVTIDGDLDTAMTRLDGVDLLVINAGDPWRGEGDPPTESSLAGFAAALDRGIGVLGVHAAAASMRDYPDWAAAFGAVWLPNLSWHPPGGVATISVTDVVLGSGLVEFEVLDERYSGLQRIGRAQIIATHEVEGVRYPTAWIRRYGEARIAADLLGHDERSYDSEGRRALLARLAQWAVGLKD